MEFHIQRNISMEKEIKYTKKRHRAQQHLGEPFLVCESVSSDTPYLHEEAH